MSETLIPTPRTTLHRRPSRGSYDRETIEAILDEALVCHLAFVVDGQPYALPTAYARVGRELYLHGSIASRMLSAANAAPIGVTVTLLDGLVLARSAFHHSMNYRSVVILGVPREVTDPVEKRAAFDALVEHVLPGRSRATRPANDDELAATRVLALAIDEASAKVRRGPPIDAERDYEEPYWAGVVPLRLVAGAPEPCPRLASDRAAPAIPPRA